MYTLYLHGLAALAIAQAPDSITLQQALARAQERRPRVAASAAGVERARGVARLASTVPNPTSQFERDAFPPNHKLIVTQSLAWIPRRGADLAAGRAIVVRARADSAQSLAEVGRDVRRTFFGALAADRQLVLAAEQTTLADSLARLAARRAAAGDISHLERDQVALEASRARLVAAQAREIAELARRELARAIAWEALPSPRPAGRLDEDLDAMANGAASSASLSVDSLPTVIGAVADAAAAAARLRAARIARIPVPGLVAGREWGGGDGSGNLILGVALPVPLWSQGGEAVQQARGAAAEQAAFAAEAKLVARAQLDAALVRVEEGARRARFARDTLLPEARRVRAGAVRLYEEGHTSVVPVLDALRSERDVTRAAVVELLAFQEARADLDAVLGRQP